MEKQHSFLNPSPQEKAAAAHKSKSSSTTSNSKLVVFIDGAARGNPGPAGAGIHIQYGDGLEENKGIYLGKKTNNQAEYLALALALFFAEKLCSKHDITKPHLSIFSDSELLIKQMRGEYKVKNEILAHIKSLIGDQAKHFTSVQFAHVRREKNKEADRLANLGVDEKHKIPVAFNKLLSDYGLLI